SMTLHLYKSHDTPEEYDDLGLLELDYEEDIPMTSLGNEQAEIAVLIPGSHIEITSDLYQSPDTPEEYEDLEVPHSSDPLELLKGSNKILIFLTHADDEVLLTPILAGLLQTRDCRIVVLTE